MSTIRVDIVAADRKVWEGEATQLIARTLNGDIGILPNHTPLLAVLADQGNVVVDTVGQGRKTIEACGGFLSVDQNVVTVVADEIDDSALTN